MKNIIITGTNSFIGTSFEKYLKRKPKEYHVDTIDMKDASWKQNEFSKYDVVFHVAGIAHVSPSPKVKDLYYRINRDLAIETAEKAKVEGVKQFILLSSIIVYGESSSKRKVIDLKTIPTPSNHYGRSKLQAEEGIERLRSNIFKTVVIRLPMIYGKGSKGNYPKLAKIAKKIPAFPEIENERSMLHIDNLCEFVKIMIDYEESGLYFPQNNEYVNTSELVKIIGEIHGNKIWMTRVFNPALTIMIKKFQILRKIFGYQIYEKSISNYVKANYRIRTFRESIELTEI